MLLYQVFNTITGKVGYKAAAIDFNQEIPTGVVNGTNTDFVTSATPAPTSSLLVFIDGALIRNTQYTFNAGTNTITFSSAPKLGQTVDAYYSK